MALDLQDSYYIIANYNMVSFQALKTVTQNWTQTITDRIVTNLIHIYGFCSFYCHYKAKLMPPV